MTDQGNQRHSIRREYQRLPVRVCALVHARERFQTVVVADFSRGGVQLQGSFGLASGDEITLELLSGHRLQAKVVWSLGSSLGAKFVGPLRPDDVRLAALQQALDRRRASTGSDRPAARKADSESVGIE